MLRKLAAGVAPTIHWLKRNQRIRPQRPVVKVNVGSSLQVAQDWYNIDGSLSALAATWPRVLQHQVYRISTVKQWYSWEQFHTTLSANTFIFHDLRYGIPFTDSSVDFLYSSHLLEHLFREDAVRMLAEMRRVLRTEGRLRICVPDLAKAVEFYLAGNKIRSLGYFFASSQVEDLGRHRYMYDFDLLLTLLNEMGFRLIERCAFGVGQVPDVERLDNRQDETLYVEAVK
jgi:predicted SAM-dependent methyltransferase